MSRGDVTDSVEQVSLRYPYTYTYGYEAASQRYYIIMYNAINSFWIYRVIICLIKIIKVRTKGLTIVVEMFLSRVNIGRLQ